MTNDLSSPTCFAADGHDVYMGYAAPDELLTALKELRKLKCVGRRLASAVAESADDPKLAQLVAIHSEEDAHWVVVLSRHIQRLGGSADLLESKSLKPDDLSKCAIDIIGFDPGSWFVSRRWCLEYGTTRYMRISLKWPSKIGPALPVRKNVVAARSCSAKRDLFPCNGGMRSRARVKRLKTGGCPDARGRR